MSKIIWRSFVLCIVLLNLIDLSHAGCAEMHLRNPIYYEPACMLEIETGNEIFFEDRELAEFYNCENFMIGLPASKLLTFLCCQLSLIILFHFSSLQVFTLW